MTRRTARGRLLRLVFAALLLAGAIAVLPLGRAGATPATLAPILQMGSGSQHGCALVSNGTVRCWGNRSSDQVPSSSEICPGNRLCSTRPLVVHTATDILSHIVELSVGGGHACGMRSDGTVWCWGNGALGDGNLHPTTSPFAVQVRNPAGTGALTGVAHLFAASDGTCATMLDGTARCWGGTLISSYLPVVVKNANGTPMTNVVEIEMGVGLYGPMCALLGDHTARCWGSNTYGQLGIGTTTDSETPVVVKNPSGTGPLTGIAHLSVSYSDRNVCASLLAGGVDCWGMNFDGQLGIGTTSGPQTCQSGISCSTRPVAVETSDGSTALSGVADVSVNFDNACAQTTAGTVYCWGANGVGDLGDGSTTNRSLPVLVHDTTNSGSLQNVVALSKGQYQTCALINDDSAVCWGDNHFGQLGNGATPNSAFPVVVADGDTPVLPSPNSPTSPSATAGLQQATVSWTAPVDNGTPILGVMVTASPGGQTVEANTPAASAVVPNLTGGVSYTFTVHAISTNGDSAESTASNAVVVRGPPQAPTSTASVPQNGAATISWKPPTNPGSAPITGYIVTPWVDGSTLSSQEFDSTATTQTIAGLTNGQRFAFTVAAINSEGYGPTSTFSPEIVIGIPTKPNGARVAPGPANKTTGSLTVSFKPGPSNGSMTTRFVARCSSSNGGIARSGNQSGNTPAPINVAGVTTKKTYRCSVTAYNSGATNGPSALSAPVVVGVPKAPPRPTVQRTAPGALKVTINSADGNGAPMTAFTGMCTSSNGGVARSNTVHSFVPITVTGLSVGKTYTCTVKATNARGTGASSPPSAAVKA